MSVMGSFLFGVFDFIINYKIKMNSATRVEEETELAINVPESLELDEEYTKPSEIRWGRCTPFVMRDGIPRIVIGPHCIILKKYKRATFYIRIWFLCSSELFCYFLAYS